jgi:hypothetical protein
VEDSARAHAVELARASGPQWIIKEFPVRLYGGIANRQNDRRHLPPGGRVLDLFGDFPYLIRARSPAKGPGRSEAVG